MRLQDSRKFNRLCCSLASASGAQARLLQRHVEQYQQHLDRMSRELLCYRAGLDDPEFNETLLRYS